MRAPLAAALFAALAGCAPPADTGRPAAQTESRVAPAPTPAARRPESPQKFADLRSLLRARREHEARRDAAASRPPRAVGLGGARSAVQAQALDGAAAQKTDEDLRKLAALPAIRERCRERFGADAFDEQTLDRLSDWLCTSGRLTAEEVERMPLSEVADRLDAAAPVTGR
jgi:hypothetical protein